MFVGLLATVLLAALVSPSQEHAIGSLTCGHEFQQHIQKAVNIKLECSSAVFKDCCQVTISV